MPCAVDFEYEWRPIDRGFTRPTTAWGDAGNRLRVNSETSGGQARVKLEDDLDRAVEHVAHLASVIAQLGGQFGVQGGGVRGELVMIVLGQADSELVGHQPLVAGHELGLGIELPLQPCGDLYRLYVALECAREGAADSSLHFLLKARENAHVPPFPEVKLDGI